MVEQRFGPLGPDDSEATDQSLELAEQILDELSRAGHDWRVISRLATDLAETAAAMAAQT